MRNDLELLDLDVDLLRRLPLCFHGIYTKATQQPGSDPMTFKYSQRYRSLEFSVAASEKPVSKIFFQGTLE